jgi:Fe-S-cluster-containing hydrogenase component 2
MKLSQVCSFTVTEQSKTGDENKQLTSKMAVVCANCSGLDDGVEYLMHAVPQRQEHVFLQPQS